jgi:integrase
MKLAELAGDRTGDLHNTITSSARSAGNRPATLTTYAPVTLYPPEPGHADGAKAPTTSFHSFRHCYRDAFREGDISQECVRALGGWHSKRGAEEIYGTRHRPRRPLGK